MEGFFYIVLSIISIGLSIILIGLFLRRCISLFVDWKNNELSTYNMYFGHFNYMTSDHFEFQIYRLMFLLIINVLLLYWILPDTFIKNDKEISQTFIFSAWGLTILEIIILEKYVRNKK